jgi:type IV secretory pathway TraG/TraD family ATPase VirD4
LAIINNLIPESIQKPDFWIRSAQALLTATIWYLRKHHPVYCTLPHVVNLLVGEDHEKLLELLREDYECASMIRSIVTAVDLKASGQIAGMISSLQVALARINSPEICYVLTGDEFDLDINHSVSPKVLCIGSSPTLSDTFAPVIACLVSVATKQMNRQGKRHSFVLLDEGPTLFIPKLDQLPATARSNKVATVYMAQDFSQMKKQYGQNEADALISNLNNQFFGRVASLSTAEYVSRLFGKEDRLLRSEGHSDNQTKASTFGLDNKAGSGSYGSSVSYSLQERTVIHPQELLQLEVGHFLGNTVETGQASFSARFKPTSYFKEPLPIITTHVDRDLNYQRIILEAQAILQGMVAQEVV